DPKGKDRPWLDAVRAEASGHRPAVPLEGPLSLCITFTMPRPNSHYLKRGLRTNAPTLVSTKPDLDNTCKGVMDILTQLRFWHDDAQIAALMLHKRYGEDCGARVILEQCEPQSKKVVRSGNAVSSIRPARGTNARTGWCGADV